ncbi:ADP-ribosylhydrolase ARH3 isoform X3 [Pseudorca crassidens]|uniref:ADP-ribosylhydrolase ARH3 isoform X3 n=1 Tax=Pseudorca crassidens TaxID=82174 RepID=UPI00352C72E7
MAAAAVMTAAGCGGAGAARSLSRFRGCLAGALLGDCVGAVYEARDTVDLTSVLRRVQDLEPDPGSPGSAQTEALCYTDDTAMARALVQSLLAKEAFDEMDMAHRFAQEYKKDPDRGYGAGVITVFRKLLSPKCRDVFEPARAQFNGKGSYGNGGAMRVAGISLAYSSVQDVQKVGHGGASVLQPTEEDWGASRAGLSDQRGGGVRARATVPSALKINIPEMAAGRWFFTANGDSTLLCSGHYAECFTSRMSFDPCTSPARIPNFIHSLHEELNPGYRNHTASRSASRDLNPGNGIAAFESVPTAIYCFLRCMEPDPEIPSAFNSLQRTLIYSISLGGDTDTIATMAGAIAGAYYGMEQVPESWQQSCEGYEETDVLAQSLHRVFQKNL